MRKFLKLFFTFIFFTMFFSFQKSVEANSIDKISINAYIDSSGNASITEVWKCSVNQGTEVYHPYYNLGQSKITDLSVSENNTNYSALPSWNTSGSLSEKAYKCGINQVSNGVELCWGISSYGNNTYTIKYNISNFIANLTDSQMLYWTFIPYDFSDDIGNVYIKINSFYEIDNSVGVWGYGNYGGTAYVYNGCIEMNSEGSLPKNEYMTMLVQFPSNTFNIVDNNINHDFNYYLDMANNGATKYQENSPTFFESISSIIMIIFIAITCIFIGIKSSENTLKFGAEGKKIPKNVSYFRDIPFDGKLFESNYVALNYNISKNDSNIIGAILLKWLQKDIITIKNTSSNGIYGAKATCSLILNSEDANIYIINKLELKLFNMLLEASNNGILEQNEFKNWCYNNYTKLNNWIKEIKDTSRDILVSQGFINYYKKTYAKFFHHDIYEATSQLKEKALQLAGLKKFLLDYTLIKDKQPLEVKLLEDYLIYAQMMGIAKTVSKQFKNLYPDIIDQSHFSSYDNIILMNTYIYSGISSYEKAQNYSSGGGGFSSGGGGAGSFGGGSGRRRFPLKIIWIYLKSNIIYCKDVMFLNFENYIKSVLIK